MFDETLAGTFPVAGLAGARAHSAGTAGPYRRQGDAGSATTRVRAVPQYDHFAMASLLRRLLGGKQRQPAALITGVVGEDPKGGWSVTWAGDGIWPPDVHAASLTQAADQGAAAVAALYAQQPPVPDAELQLAIYPWGYQRGPIFDISGHAGALTARDIQGSERSVSGATLEDLVAAVRQIPDLPADDSMFRWVRQVASLPAALP